MNKNDVCIFTRDSLGNEENLNRDKSDLQEFASSKLPTLKQVFFLEKGSVLEENREVLNNLFTHLQQKHTKWVLVPHINRIYRPEYENGMEKLNEIVSQILSSGAGIISFKEKKVLTHDGKIYNLEEYDFSCYMKSDYEI